MNKQLVQDLIDKLKPSREDGPEILTDESPGYDERSRSFNSRFQFRPSVIVLVENSEQVSQIVKFAQTHSTEITLRVRSGGHDHEGESSGTDTLLIDFSKMNSVRVTGQGADAIVSIGPGARLVDIKSALEKHGLGIAYGACGSVGITGYTLGGGWGPWTRRHGMGCERLIGATIVLGNGEIVTLGPEAPANSPEERLLWALRGGGGFSYGIVTELKFKPFELPKQLYTINLKCKASWPNRTTLEILQCWENAIVGNQNPQLLGTNLRVVAVHLPTGKEPDPNAVLDCFFFGCFAGTEEEARKMIVRYFGEDPAPGTCEVKLLSPPATGLQADPTKDWPFDQWDMHVPREKGLEQLATDSNPIEPGIELGLIGPAPHKITSRLADASWNDESRKALICALQSSLVQPMDDGKSNKFPINQWITLGAITGPFYATYDERKEEPPSAFPYKDRLFTIQFQAWWNQYLRPDWKPTVTDPSPIQQSILANQPWVNRAEDWIDACRDYAIPHTSGAFINFKDSSVRTETYFDKSYRELRNVKEKYSWDKHMLFRSRKTII